MVYTVGLPLSIWRSSFVFVSCFPLGKASPVSHVSKPSSDVTYLAIVASLGFLLFCLILAKKCFRTKRLCSRNSQAAHQYSDRFSQENLVRKISAFEIKQSPFFVGFLGSPTWESTSKGSQRLPKSTARNLRSGCNTSSNATARTSSGSKATVIPSGDVSERPPRTGISRHKSQTAPTTPNAVIYRDQFRKARWSPVSFSTPFVSGMEPSAALIYSGSCIILEGPSVQEAQKSDQILPVSRSTPKLKHFDQRQMVSVRRELVTRPDFPCLVRPSEMNQHTLSPPEKPRAAARQVDHSSLSRKIPQCETKGAYLPDDANNSATVKIIEGGSLKSSSSGPSFSLSWTSPGQLHIPTLPPQKPHLSWSPSSNTRRSPIIKPSSLRFQFMTPPGSKCGTSNPSWSELAQSVVHPYWGSSASCPEAKSNQAQNFHEHTTMGYHSQRYSSPLSQNALIHPGPDLDSTPTSPIDHPPSSIDDSTTLEDMIRQLVQATSEWDESLFVNNKFKALMNDSKSIQENPEDDLKEDSPISTLHSKQKHPHPSPAFDPVAPEYAALADWYSTADRPRLPLFSIPEEDS